MTVELFVLSRKAYRGAVGFEAAFESFERKW